VLRNTEYPIITRIFSHVIKYQDPRESEIKKLLSLPNLYFPIVAHKAGQIYLGVFGDMPHT
jgi:hypothetical protein